MIDDFDEREDKEIFDFEMGKDTSSIIKVLGIGGGGSNSATYMFNTGLNQVDICICNTDRQALDGSPVLNKIQLGLHVTKGLGAGENPEIGKEAAEESIELVRTFLEGNTEMLFITAGMGGGTGTGAAPVIAKLAQELNILTVAIVTTPFAFEGRKRMQQAKQGIKNLRQHVDALILIDNNKISQMYGDFLEEEAYSKADTIVSNAAMGISEVINKNFGRNIDLNDVRTVLKDAGTAIMGVGLGQGEERGGLALFHAVNSPLLNSNNISSAKKVLLLVTYGEQGMSLRDVEEVGNTLIQEEFGGKLKDMIFGSGMDKTLAPEETRVTIIATGFEDELNFEGETRNMSSKINEVYAKLKREQAEKARKDREEHNIQVTYPEEDTFQEEEDPALLDLHVFTKEIEDDKSETQEEVAGEETEISAASLNNAGTEEYSQEKSALESSSHQTTTDSEDRESENRQVTGTKVQAEKSSEQEREYHTLVGEEKTAENRILENEKETKDTVSKEGDPADSKREKELTAEQKQRLLEEKKKRKIRLSAYNQKGFEEHFKSLDSQSAFSRANGKLGEDDDTETDGPKEITPLK